MVKKDSILPARKEIQLYPQLLPRIHLTPASASPRNYHRYKHSSLGSALGYPSPRARDLHHPSLKQVLALQHTAINILHHDLRGYAFEHQLIARGRSLARARCFIALALPKRERERERNCGFYICARFASSALSREHNNMRE